jgi:hypothetical protein
MRLSQQKARQLNALVWRERLRRLLPLVALVVGATALVTVYLARQVERADRTVDITVHKATVIDIKRHGNGRGGGIVRVHLEDGRKVEAFSMARVDPAAGAHVVVNEARHASGRLTYDIARLAE